MEQLHPPFEKGNPGGPGRPPEPWKDWLKSLEPAVREKWIATFKAAGPNLRYRMMTEFFDRLHGTPKQTVETTGNASLKINITRK